MRQETTKRLYFNKWPIKIECWLKGSYRVHRMGPLKTIEWCDGHSDYPWGAAFDKTTDKKDLKEFCIRILPFIGKEYQVRSEGGHYNIFLKDKELSKQFVSALYPWIMSITEPESDAEWNYLMDNGPKKVLCVQYPHGKFRYKVFLDTNFERNARLQFLDWVKKYPDNMKLSETIEKWLKGERFWVQDPFFYISDAKNLSLALLYLGGNHKKIHEFILKSSINT